MSSPIEPGKKAGSALQRLPKLGTSVWLILIFCLFLIAVIPMATGYMEQSGKQAALREQVSQLQVQYDMAKAKMAGQAALAAEVSALRTEAATAGVKYKNIADNAEISRQIMSLAWKYGITMVSMSVTTSKSTVLGTTYPVLVYSLSLSGQVAGFQNFIIELGSLFPSSQFLDVIISPAGVEGEMDKATVTLQIYCNPG